MQDRDSRIDRQAQTREKASECCGCCWQPSARARYRHLSSVARNNQARYVQSLQLLKGCNPGGPRRAQRRLNGVYRLRYISLRKCLKGVFDGVSFCDCGLFSKTVLDQFGPCLTAWIAICLHRLIHNNRVLGFFFCQVIQGPKVQ